MEENVFNQIDFGPLQEYLDNDDVTDISYSQSQIHLKTLSQGNYRVENPAINNAFMEKMAFQCANAMGKTFNMAHPMLDSESAELRMNFIHDSISRNGIACVIRKTPAKIRLEKQKLLNEDYITEDIHDFLITCIKGHCNIIACGETGSGKTEFIKYLASKIADNEKIITIEDTLELHLDRIFPHRDIVTLKTNNIASYSDVLVACMRQNPIWILLSEVRSAEAVTAVRNSISSGHFILSTIHADKSASIPMRLYSLMETSQDVQQFLTTVYRYIQLGVCIRGRQDKVTKKFKREIADISEFYVDENNIPRSHLIYRKTMDGRMIRSNPTKYLIDYLDAQGVEVPLIEETNTISDDAPDLPKGVKFTPANTFTGEETKEDSNTTEEAVKEPVTPVTPELNNEVNTNIEQTTLDEQNDQINNIETTVQEEQTSQIVETEQVPEETNVQLANAETPSVETQNVQMTNVEAPTQTVSVEVADPVFDTTAASVENVSPQVDVNNMFSQTQEVNVQNEINNVSIPNVETSIPVQEPVVANTMNVAPTMEAPVAPVVSDIPILETPVINTANAVPTVETSSTINSIPDQGVSIFDAPTPIGTNNPIDNG